MTILISHKAELPATASQQGLLVLDRQIPVRNLYNLTYSIHLAHPHDPRLLRAALMRVTLAQPALRTVFHEAPAIHATITAAPAAIDFPFEYHELQADDQVQHAIDDLGSIHYDMYRGPLYRFAYFYSEQQAVLVFGIHHAVFDYYSLKPFLEDLHWMLTDPPASEALADLQTTREELYAIELAAQERYASATTTAAQADELAERMRGAAQTTLYPHPARPVETTFQGTSLTWRILGNDAERIRAATRLHGITPYEFFMTAFTATIGRHCSAGDVSVGNVFFGRRTAGSLGLAGFFVNTLPVRVQLDWKAPFGEFAATDLRSTVEFTRTRGKVTFNALVERLNPERSGNRNPVFASMIALYDAAEYPETIRSVGFPANGTAKFDVWLGIWASDGGWRLAMEYDRELIPAEVALDLQASLQTAIFYAAAEESVTLAGLFEDASREQSAAADGFWTDPPARSLVEWVLDATVNAPDHVAIERPGTQITYADLDASVSRVAASLRALEVRPGDVVGLYLDDIVSVATGMLAVMRIGAAYLPLDGATPAQRLTYMTAMAGCQLIIGPADIPGVRSVELSELDVPSRASAAAVTGEATYVMFTSGSSGMPKGIHMAESALRNLTAWQLAALGMSPSTRFLQYAPLGFDVSFQEIIPTLCAGGTIVSRQPAKRQDFAALADRIDEASITHVYLPVAALRYFAQAVADSGRQLASLTHLCVSGEQLVIDDDIRGLFLTHPHCTLINLYGPTETHAVITQRFSVPSSRWPSHAPIGTPITGVNAYVIDATGHLAPAGVSGELYLGGACPALGYINDRERTESGFVPDRFGGGTSMYRTGDQIMREGSGKLIFLGRGDDQVKVRGFRVELGEIDAAAREVDGVGNAVAVARDVHGTKEIVLFAITENVSRDQLRTELRRVLPDYMIPAQIVLLDRIPVTDNGKVDRAALLRGAESAPETVPVPEEEYASTLEQELAEMWAQLLNVVGVERHRSVLEYGAHSIMMFNGVRQINKRYGVELSIADMFGALTVADLATRIEGLINT